REVGMESSSGSGWRAALLAARVEPRSVLPEYAPRLVRPPDGGIASGLVGSAAGETQFPFRPCAGVATADAREGGKRPARRATETAGKRRVSKSASPSWGPRPSPARAERPAGSRAECADHLLEGCAVWHAALRDARRAAATPARLGQRRLERGAGVHAGILGCGEQQGGRIVDRRDEHGFRERDERVRERAELLEPAAGAPLDDPAHAVRARLRSLVERPCAEAGQLLLRALERGAQLALPLPQAGHQRGQL